MDFNRARRETPGCANVLHFNNAGAGLMPQPTLDAVVNHLQLEAAMGGYEAAARAHEAVEHVYDAISALIGCRRAEVAIIENATRAWDMAFYSLPFQPGDRILTSMAEYASNYIAFLHLARRRGVEVQAVPDDEYGQISTEQLEKMIDARVKLIAITHVPTNGGLVNPAAAVGRIARAAGIPYLLDACQSIGQMPIHVDEIGCDMLSATGRKYLRGPRGTGFLYVRAAMLPLLDPPMIDLHAATWTSVDNYELRPDARRFENWETYYAGKIGLGVAVDYAMSWDISVTWQRIQTLASALRSRLAALRGVTVRDLGEHKCGIVTFTVDGMPSAEVVDRLSRKAINVSFSTCFSTRLDMQRRGLSDVVRASLHYYNSEEEIDRFCAALEDVTTTST